jgi:prolyl oligopeptidase
LKPAKYPATMVMTADHDDRVVPAHSFKFISTLQPAQQGDAPVLIRVETNAGHGAGKPTSKIIEEQADKWSLLLQATPVSLPLLHCRAGQPKVSMASRQSRW